MPRLRRRRLRALKRAYLHQGTAPLGAGRLQTPVFFPQGFAAFGVRRVYRNAGHWADLHALGLVKVAYAFGAFVRVNLVNLRAHVDGLVGAFGLADVAVNAFVGNDQGHGAALFPAL